MSKPSPSRNSEPPAAAGVPAPGANSECANTKSMRPSKLAAGTNSWHVVEANSRFRQAASHSPSSSASAANWSASPLLPKTVGKCEVKPPGAGSREACKEYLPQFGPPSSPLVKDLLATKSSSLAVHSSHPTAQRTSSSVGPRPSSSAVVRAGPAMGNQGPRRTGPASLAMSVPTRLVAAGALTEHTCSGKLPSLLGRNLQDGAASCLPLPTSSAAAANK
mmetsp:Transcript_28494/g.90097  ORF Transcript_28494/g.90097 Transcript_28494/m.90097 type:complete len:220 (-) Transcript_28494:68-727(-)